ncbi:Endoribonuclease YSH1, partial [Tolypocladium ophioglossoides CBS 100239]
MRSRLSLNAEVLPINLWVLSTLEDLAQKAAVWAKRYGLGLIALPEFRSLKSGKEADIDADGEGDEKKVPKEADEEVGEALVVAYLVMGCVTSPPAVKRSSAKHSHSHSYGGPFPGARIHEDTNEIELEECRKKEMERLHKIGIYVPGVEITVDKMVATVWLEDLEIEYINKVFENR